MRKREIASISIISNNKIKQRSSTSTIIPSEQMISNNTHSNNQPSKRHSTTTSNINSLLNSTNRKYEQNKSNATWYHRISDKLYIWFLKVCNHWNNLNKYIKRLIYCMMLFIIFWYYIIVQNIFDSNYVYSVKSNTSYLLGLRDYNEVYSPNYIWKFGLAMLSDKHDRMHNIISTISSPYISDFELFNNIQHGDVIWLREQQLDDFVRKILPNIDKYFTVLIATNLAWITPLYYDESHYTEVFDKLINNQYLLYLFVEDYDGTLSKKYDDIIDMIPIGMDFKTPYVNPGTGERMFGHHDTPSMQEYKIKQLLNDENNIIKPFDLQHRELKIYLDYALDHRHKMEKYLGFLEIWKEKFGLDWMPNNNYRTLRNNFSDDIVRLYSGKQRNRKRFYRSWVIWRINNNHNVNGSLFYIDSQKYNQYDGWIKRSSYIFALSPFGNGLDCHRTYESLLFGNIVIKQTGPLDILFQKHDLPVVIINDYKDINETMLYYWYNKYKNKVSLNNATTRYKLTNDYWMSYIRRKTLSKLSKKLILDSGYQL